MSDNTFDVISKDSHDKKVEKLGCIIENHMDDGDWLLKELLGIEETFKYRKNQRLDREKIKAFIELKNTDIILN